MNLHAHYRKYCQVSLLLYLFLLIVPSYSYATTTIHCAQTAQATVMDNMPLTTLPDCHDRVGQVSMMTDCEQRDCHTAQVIHSNPPISVFIPEPVAQFDRVSLTELERSPHRHFRPPRFYLL